LAWLAESATDNQLPIGQINRLPSHMFEQKSNLLVQISNCLLVNVVLAEIRGVKLVIG